MQIRFFAVLFLSVLFTACSTENGNRLKEADSVMEEYPDSAMSILMRIDRHSLNSRDLPYYALLYTQAQVKTYISLDSDSLMSIAFEKYGENTRGNLGIRSNFYMGEVFFNQKKHREAMRYYLKAYEESKRLNNDYWHAKAAERMTDLFFQSYHYDEAEKFAKEAANYFNKSNRTINHRYLLAFLSIIYLNNKKVDSCYSLLDSLYNLSINEDSVDSTFLEYIEQPLLESAVKLNKINSVDIETTEYFREDMSDGEKIDAVMLLNSISGTDKNKEIKTFLNDISPLATDDDDRTHILYAKYENAKSLNDLTLAISYVDSLLDYQVMMTEKIIKESITGVQRDFYSDMSIQQKRKTSFLTYVLIISLTAFIIIVFFIVVIFHLKSKAQKAKLESNLESLLSLKSYSERLTKEKDLAEEQLEALNIDKETTSRIHEQIVERLFKEKWMTLDTLCSQYFGFTNSELSSKTLINNIEKELKKVLSKKSLDEIVAAVDYYMCGIINRLRNQCPFLKDEDINFIALTYAGFSVRAVCLFTGMKYQHYYVKKYRLVKRIQNSDAPEKDLFIEKMK